MPIDESFIVVELGNSLSGTSREAKLQLLLWVNQANRAELDITVIGAIVRDCLSSNLVGPQDQELGMQYLHAITNDPNGQVISRHHYNGKRQAGVILNWRLSRLFFARLEQLLVQSMGASLTRQSLLFYSMYDTKKQFLALSIDQMWVLEDAIDAVLDRRCCNSLLADIGLQLYPIESTDEAGRRKTALWTLTRDPLGGTADAYSMFASADIRNLHGQNRGVWGDVYSRVWLKLVQECNPPGQQDCGSIL